MNQQPDPQFNNPTTRTNTSNHWWTANDVANANHMSKPRAIRCLEVFRHLYPNPQHPLEINDIELVHFLHTKASNAKSGLGFRNTLIATRHLMPETTPDTSNDFDQTTASSTDTLALDQNSESIDNCGCEWEESPTKQIENLTAMVESLMNKLEFLELDKIELKCQLEVLDHKLEETKNTIRSNNEFVASLHVRQNALVQQFEYFKMALGNLLPIICNKLNMNSPRI